MVLYWNQCTQNNNCHPIKWWSVKKLTLKGRRLSKYYQDITTLNYITTLVCMLFPLVTSKNVKKLNSLSKKEKNTKRNNKNVELSICISYLISQFGFHTPTYWSLCEILLWNGVMLSPECPWYKPSHRRHYPNNWDINRGWRPPTGASSFPGP